MQIKADAKASAMQRWHDLVELFQVIRGTRFNKSGIGHGLFRQAEWWERPRVEGVVVDRGRV